MLSRALIALAVWTSMDKQIATPCFRGCSAPSGGSHELGVDLYFRSLELMPITQATHTIKTTKNID